MRALYYRFRQCRGNYGARDTAPGTEEPSVAARRLSPPRPDVGVPQPTTEDDRSPSPRVRDAATRLRSGEVDVQRIATLTGVPAALVELMQETATVQDYRLPTIADVPDPHRAPCAGRGTPTRLLTSAAALSVVAIGVSLLGVDTGRPAAGQLAAAAAALALLGCHLVGRPPRQR